MRSGTDSTKFIFRKGIRYIYSSDSMFSQWYPRGKFLDNRIEAEEQAWEIMRI